MTSCCAGCCAGAERRADEERAGCLSAALFCWISPLFSKAYALRETGDAIAQSDLACLPRDDRAAHVSDTFRRAWDKYTRLAVDKFPNAPAPAPGSDNTISRKRAMWALRKASFAVLGPTVYRTAGFVKALNSALQFSYPVLLAEIIAFVAGDPVLGTSDPPTWMGVLLCILLFVAMTGKAVCENRYFHLVIRGGWQLRSALSTAVYGKSLRLTAAARQTKTLGQIVNLMQIDTGKLELFVNSLHVIWDGGFQICGYMAILLLYIGWPALVGLVVMIAAIPVQKKIMLKLFMTSRRMVSDTDRRVKLTNECLQGIQCIKMYAWEASFIKVIEGFRGRELTQLKRIAYLRAFARSYMMAVPAVVSVASLVTYALAGGDVNPSTLFAALSAFNQLRFPLMFYPNVLAQYAGMKVAQARLADFFAMEELDPAEVERLRAKRGGGGAAAAASTDGNSSATAAGEIRIDGAIVSWGGASAEDNTKNMNKNQEHKPDDSDKKEEGGQLGNVAAGDVEVEAKADEPTADKTATAETPLTLTGMTPVLANLNVTVGRGELVAIVGPVGSGKSALCNTLLGETQLMAGTVDVTGSVAYAAQTAWILNASIEDNITFGRPMEVAQYRAILKACQLSHDLEILEDGDQTMIGERGINLSGGQKQRVSVARAAYADKDIVILDDPMSALDPEVGHALFRECIKGLLKHKTRILVTHSLDILQQCDRILVISADGNDGIGRIREQGTFQELVHAGLDFAKLIGKDESEGDSVTATDGQEEEEKNATTNADKEGQSRAPALRVRSSSDGSQNSASGGSATKRSDTVGSAGNANKKVAKALMEKEEREKGAVNASVYTKYIVAGGGFCWFAFVVFWYLAAAVMTVLNSAWITAWTSDATKGYASFSLEFYLGGLAVVAVLLSTVSFLRSATMALTNVAASNAMHGAALRSVMRAPTRFFDVTPIGRIISRFSKDLHTMDEELGSYMDFFIWCSLYVVSTACVITYATPWFALAIPPIGFIYVWTINYFRPVNREAKRLESVARSPVYAHFSETLGGLVTIRAFDDSVRFVRTNMALVDESIRAFYVMKISDRWLSVRLEIIGAFIAVCAALLAVLGAPAYVASSELNDTKAAAEFAAIAGLSISFAIGVTGLLNWTVRSFAMMEAGMNSAERVLHYIENIPQEADTGADRDGGGAAKWPASGALKVTDLRMRYRKDTELVLRGVSFSVESGQRIGVVGRTGAGKSSLMLALLRLVEPERHQKHGPIEWAGVDTTTLDLTTLRQAVGIIPQTPTLFSGTIRSNLDPFGQCDDAQLWDALEKCELKPAVEMMGGLDAKVAEYGENMSQGQRQLLCLGRALLKDCKLLLLDEATSSIDQETDMLVQVGIFCVCCLLSFTFLLLPVRSLSSLTRMRFLCS